MFGRKAQDGQCAARPPAGSLAGARTGETVLVIGMVGGCATRARLESMGLVPGAQVEVLNNGYRGPLLVSLGECRISLGRGIAQNVIVA